MPLPVIAQSRQSRRQLRQPRGQRVESRLPVPRQLFRLRDRFGCLTCSLGAVALPLAGRHDALRERYRPGQRLYLRLADLQAGARISELRTQFLQCLLRGVGVVLAQPALHFLGSCRQVLRPCVRDCHHLLVHADVEQVRKHLTPVPLLSRQKLLETPLRQHHADGERAVIQSDDVRDLVVHRPHPPLDRRPARLRELLQLHRRYGPRHLLPPVAPRLAGDVDAPVHLVAAAARLELQVDAHRVAVVRDQRRGAVVAGHAPVERVADRVDDRRLARPRRPGDREDVEVARSRSPLRRGSR